VPKKLVTAIAGVITVAWAVSFVLDAIFPNYEPPESVHALMLIVAGAAFTQGIIVRRDNGKVVE
jgi:hypothetical protein